MRDRAIVRRSKRAIVRERHLFGVLPSFSIYIIAYFSQKIKFFSAHSHAGSTSRRCTERGEEGAPFSIQRSSRWRRMRSRDLALIVSGLTVTAGLQPITCARSIHKEEDTLSERKVARRLVYFGACLLWRPIVGDLAQCRLHRFV